jgi:hypothetical protein
MLLIETDITNAQRSSLLVLQLMKCAFIAKNFSDCESTGELASKLPFAHGFHLWFQKTKRYDTFSMLLFK